MDLGGKAHTLIKYTIKTLSLNPCFGGFGWESAQDRKDPERKVDVLILVLVDLGGKVAKRLNTSSLTNSS